LDSADTLFADVAAGVFFGFNFHPLILSVLSGIVELPKVNRIEPDEIARFSYSRCTHQLVVFL